MLPFRTKPIPSKDASVATVATAATVQLKLLSQGLTAGGGQNGARRIITGDTFIASTDSWVGADCTAGAITVRLPFAREYPNMIVQTGRYAGANVYTVSARTGDTIDGGASITPTLTVTLTPINSTTWHVTNTSA